MFTFAEALEIANSYDVDTRYIKGDYDQAVSYDGQNGKSAKQYFIGYMMDTAAFERADAKAHSKFLMDAYGE